VLRISSSAVGQINRNTDHNHNHTTDAGNVNEGHGEIASLDTVEGQAEGAAASTVGV
jgi:hypothetical protein